MNKKGRDYEDMACEYLVKKGFKIIDKNFNVPQIGEIDIIARDGSCIVFVEVRARKKAYYRPYETVDFKKISRIIKASIFYLKKNSIDSTPVRYDVISIEEADDRFEIEHFEGAFESDGRYTL
ncbi:MAG: YraN family protein [Elusimicrobiales bacterium]